MLSCQRIAKSEPSAVAPTVNSAGVFSRTMVPVGLLVIRGGLATVTEAVLACVEPQLLEAVTV